MDATKSVTAHLPEALVSRIDRIAGDLERSRSWALRQAISDWVANEELKHQLTLDALADVEAGRVVSDVAVAAWIESLGSDTPLPAPQPCN